LIVSSIFIYKKLKEQSLSQKKILVTGGLGYIGSHTVVQLLNASFPVVIFDNLSNSSRSVIDRIIKLTGKNLWFVEGDVRNHIELRKIFKDHSIGSVIHLAALESLHSGTNSLITVNLGTGQTYSVLEVIHAFIKASGMEVPFQIVNRRMGDLAEYYADPTLAKKVLGWEAKLNIERMCEDTWRWQKNNINGFQ